jgi:hypothetical protein
MRRAWRPTQVHHLQPREEGVNCVDACLHVVQLQTIRMG